MLGIKFLWGVETICHLCQHCALTYCKDSNEKWHQRPKSLVAWLIYRANDSVKFRLSTHFSLCYVDCLQAASLFPGTSPPGRDYVQWEHEALATQDAVWQVPQCPCGDQPWGSHYFNLPVTHGVVAQRRYQLSSTGKDVSLRAVNSLLCSQLSAIAPQRHFKTNWHNDCINVCRFTNCRKCFFPFMSQCVFTILNYFVHTTHTPSVFTLNIWKIGVWELNFISLTTKGHTE